MDDIQMCGNDLRYIEYWLHHFGHVETGVLSELTALTHSLVGVLVANQVTNQRLGTQFRAEAAESVLISARKLAAVGAAAFTN